jgi:hypothetical protein
LIHTIEKIIARMIAIQLALVTNELGFVFGASFVGVVGAASRLINLPKLYSHAGDNLSQS